MSWNTEAVGDHSTPHVLDAFHTTGSSPTAVQAEPRRGAAEPRHGTLESSTGTVELRHGTVESKTGSRVAYASYGRDDAPAVLVLGGISAHRFVAGGPDGTQGWWPGVVGTGTALDPERHRLVSIDYLGGAGDSTLAEPAGPGLPVVTTADQARAVVAVLDHLEIETLAGFLGASYGGMVGLALAVAHPERLKRLLVLCAAHRSHPMATGLRVLQRRIVTLAAAAGREADGLALARELAMTTYRTPEEFEVRFASAPEWKQGAPRFAVEKYLEAQGEKFARRFDAQAFQILSQSLDLHRIAPECIHVPTTVVSVDSDGVVPPWLVAEMARRLPDSGRTVRIASNYGHDAFLKEKRVVSRLVRRFLTGEVHHG